MRESSIGLHCKDVAIDWVSVDVRNGSFASFGPYLRYVRLADNSGNAGFLLMAAARLWNGSPAIK
jgi:hypothetical protein